MAGSVIGAIRPAWIEPAHRRVGILGGTFDPIHYAHLAVAEQVREALALELVLFVPAGVPPHKPRAVVAPAEDRAAMVELAIAGNPVFSMCRIELDRHGPSYSVESLDLLTSEALNQKVERELFFILSADSSTSKLVCEATLSMRLPRTTKTSSSRVTLNESLIDSIRWMTTPSEAGGSASSSAVGSIVERWDRNAAKPIPETAEIASTGRP